MHSTLCGSSQGWKPATSAAAGSRLAYSQRIIAVARQSSNYDEYSSSGRTESAVSSSDSSNSNDGSSTAAAEEWHYEAPAHVLERRQQLREQLNGKVILAPLTKGACMRSRIMG